jgi:hypothetical protein
MMYESQPGKIYVEFDEAVSAARREAKETSASSNHNPQNSKLCHEKIWPAHFTGA